MSPVLPFVLLGLVQAGAPATEPAAPKAAPKPTGWAALRAAIAKRLAADRVRLREFLERSYLSDLALDYSDSDNRAYLDRKFDEIARADPDLGGLLLAFLDPGRRGAALRHRADNALRILERMDLTPYVPRLRELLAKGSVSARLRALDLLAGIRCPGLTETLKKYLVETPEVQVPRVLRCAGRYGDVALVPALLPFLGRPNAKQRLMALEALARLGAVRAVAPATAAVADLDTATAYGKLVGLLRAVAPEVGDADLTPFVDAILLVLSRADALGKAEVLAAIRLLAGIEPTRVRAKRTAIEPALRRLLDYRFPEVQFAAANLLHGYGDRSGIKHVLERLTSFVKKNRKVPYAYFQRARAYAAFGKVSDAMRDVSQAIRLTGGTDPTLHFFAARLEVERGNASQVLRHLKAADPTPTELRRFRTDNPGVEGLIQHNRGLARLFQG